MDFALGEHRDQHVGAGHLLAAGGLDVDRGALQDALEAGGRLGVAGAVGHQAGKLVVEIVDDVAAQPVEIDAAGAQHRGGILVLGQRQQQMLKRRIFVAPLVGLGQRPMQALLEVTREHLAGYSLVRKTMGAPPGPCRIAAPGPT